MLHHVAWAYTMPSALCGLRTVNDAEARSHAEDSRPKRLSNSLHTACYYVSGIETACFRQQQCLQRYEGKHEPEASFVLQSNRLHSLW